MSNRQPSITFEQKKYPSNAAKDGWEIEYLVVKLVNSVDYEIGQSLTRKEVKELVSLGQYMVTVIPRKF